MVTSPVIAATRSGRHAKGFRGGRSKLWKAAVEAVHRKWRYALFHRRKRKPDFRGLWIVRINAAARELGVSYSQADRRRSTRRTSPSTARSSRTWRSAIRPPSRRSSRRRGPRPSRAPADRPEARRRPRTTSGPSRRPCPARSSIAELDRLAGEFAAEIGALATEQEIRLAQARYLGKKGKVSEPHEGARASCRPPERPAVGEAANRAKSGIEGAVAARLAALDEAELSADLGARRST